MWFSIFVYEIQALNLASIWGKNENKISQAEKHSIEQKFNVPFY